MPTPLNEVMVPCKECGTPHNRGWPRCGECRKKKKAMRKQCFAEWTAMGKPGDWSSFWALWSGDPMPAQPEFRRALAAQPHSAPTSSTDQVFEWESSDP
jgi:hypothetical protein